MVLNNIFKPKSKETIIKDLKDLSQSEKGELLRNVAKNGQLESVKLLIEAGADINYKNNAGTSLMRASLYGHFEIVKYLIENGADVNTKNMQEDTALKWAIKYDYKELIELLKKHEAKE